MPQLPKRVGRRRRWPLLLLLTVLCCCGCPAYFGKPLWDQYPANAVLPVQVADLQQRDDAVTKRLTEQLRQDLENEHPLAEDVFAAVYANRSGERVTIFGVTGIRLTPEQDVAEEMERLTQTYQLSQIEVAEPDSRGQYRRCGIGKSKQTNVVVCTWADHGSMATGVFTGLSVDESNALLSEFRNVIITRS